MFKNRLSYSLIGGIAIGALAAIGFAPEANAQELIRSNLTPRGADQSNINTTNIRSNVVAPGVRSNLSLIANELNTSVDTLLSNSTIGQIAISPAGAEVLSSLQAADGITADPNNPDQFNVEQQVPRVGADEAGVIPVEPTQPASVEEALNVVEEN
ncbi:MAG: hypothetical protein ACLFRN_11145 [Halothece sp.]